MKNIFLSLNLQSDFSSRDDDIRQRLALSVGSRKDFRIPHFFTFEMVRQSDRIAKEDKCYPTENLQKMSDSHNTLEEKSKTETLASKKVSAVLIPTKGYFLPLIKALNNYFCNPCEPFDPELSVFHLKLALTLFRRKFGVKDYSLPNTSTELAHEINSLLQKNVNFSQKRTEENNKFVFKHTIKLMKKTLKSRSAEHSFSSHSEQNFRDQYDFKNDETKALSDTNISSLSLSNIRLIFKNKRFREDFFKTIEQPSVELSLFFTSYVSSIAKKLTKLFCKWNKEIQTESPSDDQATKIIYYFQNNNQCKLPWTKSEIFKAVECIVKTVGDEEQK